jgi:hypothetical protein
MHLADSVLFMGRALRSIHQTEPDWRYDTQTVHKLTGILEDECASPAAAAELIRKFDLLISDSSRLAHNKLWSVMVEGCALRRHLQLFRDVFLLGNGEFTEQFIMELERVKFQMTDFGIIFPLIFGYRL